MMAGRMVARSKGLLPVRNPLLHGLLHGCYTAVMSQRTLTQSSYSKNGSGVVLRDPCDETTSVGPRHLQF